MRSIRQKLFLLLIIMGAIPLLMVIILGAVNMISQMEDNINYNGMLRNKIISEHVTDMLEKNLYVLHSISINPMVINYLNEPDDFKTDSIKKLLNDTNTIFNDTNPMVLTSKNAQQLIRTDNSELVNVIKRQHFQEAMKGNDFISKIIVSMSTGEKIVVLESPVKNENGQPVGMIQRNFNLNALQKFVETLDEEEFYVLIIDEDGRVVANSEQNQIKVEENYNFLLNKMKKESGVIRIKINGEDSLISYSKNKFSNWIIVNVQPYHHILDQVYLKIIQAILIGFLMLVLVSTAAKLLSKRATQPIIEITNAADKIVKGKLVEELKIQREDEFGKMIDAFNKMRLSRDAYQLESELDMLTKLYNKATTEKICNIKLEKFINSNEKKLMAFYIIDLDHFKEANDTFGHQFGDEVLKEFSKKLRKNFRPTDCIGRFGGDEFIVMIDNLPGKEIIFEKARQIKNLASEISIKNVNPGITASIGIAIVPEDGTEYEKLFKSADESLYYVKTNGRNGFYHKSLESIG